ncbi:DUF7284 family protein [Halovenus halobia]|uniref:DUF7284 family protein n=1 Tax=Halovenus halobia TaxID=3396622 RepID=UPI003F56BEF9
MMQERAVNTVVDVAFALFALSVAVVLLSTVNLSEPDQPDPFEPDRTAAVLGTSTFDVSYSVEPVLEDATESSDEIDEEAEEYRSERIAHASMATHVKTAALGSLAVTEEEITSTGQQYESAIDSRVQTVLANTQFETSVTARWSPYPDASVTGSATVGAEPPPDVELRTTTLTVPSGIQPTRRAAVEAVADGGGYAAVAELVAEATVDGFLPVIESKHALERDDSTMALTRYRYERFAAVLDDADRETIRDDIEQDDVETDDANEYLAASLAEQLVDELRRSFDNPEAAARSVSTGDITIIVRTWDP